GEKRVPAAPPRPAPAGDVSVDDLAANARPAHVPAWLADLLVRAPWLRYVPLVVALVLVAVANLVSGLAAVIVCVVLAAIFAVAWVVLERVVVSLRRADTLREEAQTPAAVAELPKSPDFAIAVPGSGAVPHRGSTDSAEATRFKEALVDTAVLQQAARRGSIEAGLARAPVRG